MRNWTKQKSWISYNVDEKIKILDMWLENKELIRE